MNTAASQAAPFTCKVKFDDAGIYGCNVRVLDPRDGRWVPLHKTVVTRESWNVEPYAERCAWDDKAEATKAAQRFIRKIRLALEAA